MCKITGSQDQGSRPIGTHTGYRVTGAPQLSRLLLKAPRNNMPPPVPVALSGDTASISQLLSASLPITAWACMDPWTGRWTE